MEQPAHSFDPLSVTFFPSSSQDVHRNFVKDFRHCHPDSLRQHSAVALELVPSSGILREDSADTNPFLLSMYKSGQCGCEAVS